MAERLCGGRVVSVVERQCAEADQDNDTQTAQQALAATTTPPAPALAAPAPAPAAVPRVSGDGLRQDPGTREDSGDNRMDVDSGGDEGRKGGASPSGESASSSSSSSELECLKGHIRGLRSGCVGFS